MKKIFLILIVFVSLGFAAKAQSGPEAIGLRLGGGNNYGAEISYQHGFGGSNRLEADLSFGGGDGYSYFGLIGMYHWTFDLVNNFKWYVGPGAGLFGYSYKSGHDNDGNFNIAIGGQIGIEYNFDFPLQLSLDTRPMWFFLNDSGFGWDFALGVRYKF